MQNPDRKQTGERIDHHYNHGLESEHFILSIATELSNINLFRITLAIPTFVLFCGRHELELKLHRGTDSLPVQ